MQIDRDEFARRVETLLSVLLVSHREENQRRADRDGVTLLMFAALSIAQLLEDHYGVELTGPDPEMN